MRPRAFLIGALALYPWLGGPAAAQGTQGTEAPAIESIEVPVGVAPIDAQLDAAGPQPSQPSSGLDQAGRALDEGRLSTAVEIAVLLTVLTLLPAILITVTSFTRIVIVLSFVRRALATNELPPTQVILGLALFLTLFVMAP